MLPLQSKPSHESIPPAEMDQVESHSELIHQEAVDESSYGPHAEATNGFSLSDDDNLRTQGHEAVFKRSFSLVASLGFAFKCVTLLVYSAIIMLRYLASQMLGSAH